MEMVARPRRHLGAREIKRSCNAGARRQRQHGLHHIGVATLVVLGDGAHRRRDIDIRIVQYPDTGSYDDGVEGRQIALEVHHGVMSALRVESLERRENAVRAGWQIRIGQHRLPTSRCDRVRDLRLRAGHHDRADPGLLGATQALNNHRQAGDIGQRLARQARGRHARGNQDHRIFRGAASVRGIGQGTSSSKRVRSGRCDRLPRNGTGSGCCWVQKIYLARRERNSLVGIDPVDTNRTGR